MRRRKQCTLFIMLINNWLVIGDNYTWCCLLIRHQCLVHIFGLETPAHYWDCTYTVCVRTVSSVVILDFIYCSGFLWSSNSDFQSYRSWIEMRPLKEGYIFHLPFWSSGLQWHLELHFKYNTMSAPRSQVPIWLYMSLWWWNTNSNVL